MTSGGAGGGGGGENQGAEAAYNGGGGCDAGESQEGDGGPGPRYAGRAQHAACVILLGRSLITTLDLHPTVQGL